MTTLILMVPLFGQIPDETFKRFESVTFTDPNKMADFDDDKEQKLIDALHKKLHGPKVEAEIPDDEMKVPPWVKPEKKDKWIAAQKRLMIKKAKEAARKAYNKELRQARAAAATRARKARIAAGIPAAKHAAGRASGHRAAAAYRKHFLWQMGRIPNSTGQWHPNRRVWQPKVIR